MTKKAAAARRVQSPPQAVADGRPPSPPPVQVPSAEVSGTCKVVTTQDFIKFWGKIFRFYFACVD
jgi:hypothetical protein